MSPCEQRLQGQLLPQLQHALASVHLQMGLCYGTTSSDTVQVEIRNWVVVPRLT